jgi:Zn-dependent protease
MLRAAWTIATVRGVPVRLHVSLLLVVPFLAMGFASRDIPLILARAGIDASYLTLSPEVIGLGLAVALFVAVALHELGHALTALAQGAKVKGITLMILGGVTEIEHEDATPGQAFRMAAAGPLVNLVLAAGCWGLLYLDGLGLDAFLSLQMFFGLNLILALFNLVPAFPLDGGRMLRAALRLRMDHERATEIATSLGRILGLVGIGFGLYQSELMLALIGGLVFVAAGSEANRVGLAGRVAGLNAQQAMVRHVVSVFPSTEAAGVARHLLFSGARAAVVRTSEQMLGVLVPADLRVDPHTLAGDLLDLDRPPIQVRPTDDLGEVAAQLVRLRTTALVFDHGNALVGVITLATIQEAAEVRGLVKGLQARAERLEARSSRTDAP